MEKIVTTNSASDTIELGKKIGNLLSIKDVVLLVGDLSCGKTTLTKGIGVGLGISKNINSPTFTIVKEYQGRCPLYHLDLYRLNGLNEDFDLEELIEGDGVCVIEWPDQVSELLPKDYLKIEFERINETQRKIKIISKSVHYDKVVKEL